MCSGMTQPAVTRPQETSVEHGLLDNDAILNCAKPLAYQHAHEIQRFGHPVSCSIALAANCSAASASQ